MDILGIGPLELVLILVVALLVFGPDKLPEIGAKLGKGVRELRQLSREISQGVNTLTEPMDELRKPFDEAGQIVVRFRPRRGAAQSGSGIAEFPRKTIDDPKRRAVRGVRQQGTTPSHRLVRRTRPKRSRRYQLPQHHRASDRDSRTHCAPVKRLRPSRPGWQACARCADPLRRCCCARYARCGGSRCGG